MKYKGREQQKKNLVVCLSELTLEKKILTFSKPYLEYTDTLKNQLKDL